MRLEAIHPTHFGLRSHGLEWFEDIHTGIRENMCIVDTALVLTPWNSVAFLIFLIDCNIISCNCFKCVVLCSIEISTLYLILLIHLSCFRTRQSRLLAPVISPLPARASASTSAPTSSNVVEIDTKAIEHRYVAGVILSKCCELSVLTYYTYASPLGIL